MADTKIIINFDSEKLSAIKQFSDKETKSLETLIQDYIEKIYTKNVPLAVRQFIENKAQITNEVNKKQSKAHV